MKWYFESCRLSHVLLLGIIVWAICASWLLKEVAPVAYIGLHMATTGVFFIAFLAVDRKSKREKVVPAVQEQQDKVA
ncbi:MAG: hypothetical protein P8M30_14180 [Planctomycetaceae bacterium]|jgi:hypothetical protein|nr:hypothetical protein [bacterium]MDC0307567.1 hypothetical protein [Planctomycetaceae bacterium]MDG2390452.1 hypothetical protein [Planctomycetaceae bacterium]